MFSLVRGEKGAAPLFEAEPPLNFKFYFICLTALTLGFINHTNTLDIRLVPGRLCLPPLNNHHSFRRPSILCLAALFCR